MSINNCLSFNKPIPYRLSQLIVTVLVVIGSILATATLPVLLLYRSLVQYYAHLFRPDLDQIISGTVSLFSLEDIYQRPKCNVLIYLLSDSSKDFQTVQRAFLERCLEKKDSKGQLVYQQFRQVQQPFGGYHFWRWDQDFDVSRHVRPYDYGEGPGESGLSLRGERTTEEDLQRVMAGLLARKWEEGRSPWELLVITNYAFRGDNPHFREYCDGNNNKRTLGVLLRFHHTLGDGYSYLKLLMEDLAGLRGAEVARPKFPSRSLMDGLLFSLALPFRLPYDFAETLLNLFDGPNEWHALRGSKLSREYLTSISQPVSVNLVKEIKRKYGVSYIGVLCAVLCGGLRRVMIDGGQKVPKFLSCVLPFPWPNHPGGLAVHISLAVTKLPIRQASLCPRVRLKQVSARFEKSPLFTGHIGNLLALKYAGLLPNSIRRRIYKSHKTTAILSNFPGPKSKPNFLGATVPDIMVGCGLGEGNIGVSVMMVSLGELQRFVVNVDKSVFSNEKIFQRLGNYIQEELHLLAKEPLHSPGAAFRV